ncbi:MAG: putative DNA binding domain-containing protein [Bacteroidales bacterium]|nr:putative DNA binding domain-containing protein [Bacteroidales bacterium]
MLTEKDIRELVHGGEGFNVDFKRSVPSKVRDIAEEVCSFANSAGGYVLIGVDNGNQIIGAEIDNNRRSAIQDAIGEISPMLHYDMYHVEVDGRRVWVIDVPSGKSKPYFFSGSTYIREGANCQKLTNVDEIRNVFQKNDRIYFDAIPLPKVDLGKELDEENFREFRYAAGIAMDIGDGQILENMQIYDDNDNVKSGGVLFFARHPENIYFHAVIRCVLFKGTDKVYILDDKTFGGPLLQQYKRAVEWLKSKLKVAYEMEGTGPRKETWEIPLSVFKESIINALSHRDYYEQGASIMIEMYDDRIEISNPGDLLPVVAKNFGRKSLSRNPLIFGLFTRMHLVEHVGSGIPRMKKDMLDAGLPEPIFETEGMFTVIFKRPAAMQAIKEQAKDFQLTEIQREILSAITDKPNITMDELGAMLNLGRSSIYKNLKQLKEQSILMREGRKRDGRWVIKQV